MNHPSIRLNDVPQPHRQPLCAMAEFMSDDASKLARVLSRDERQRDIHNQVVTEKTQPAAAETCARIEIACQIDARRHADAQEIGNMRDELIKPWMLRRIQLQGLS